jgi:cell wall assembly regulator SMI1
MSKPQGLKSRRIPPCGPVDVPAVWKRIEVALQRCSPGLAGRLAAGAKVKDIKAFEKALGRELPEEVRQSFRVHDGERSPSSSPPYYIFVGLTFCPLKQTQSEWTMWRGIEGDDGLETYARENGSSTPKDAIRLGYTNHNWIELIDTGGSNYFGVDFEPGRKGLSGHVIKFGRDEEHKVVLAWSWGWFLNDLAEELERGNFRHEDGADGGMVLINPAPPHNTFFNVAREWSNAKLGGRRPFDPLSSESLVPLQQDRTVQAVARGIASSNDFASLPILADALEDAGCTDARLLAHCRFPGEHGCGCWAVNLLLGEQTPFDTA